MLVPLNIPPGISRPGTKYDARGRWWDANLVRWHEKAMKPIGGWTKLTNSSDAAVNVTYPVRTMIAWRANDQTPHLAFTTYCKLYVFVEGVLTDVSPVGLTCGGVSSVVTGTTYGEGNYGEGPYSSGDYGMTALTEANTWQLDTFGEDLVAVAYSDGKLYQWDTSVGVGTVAAVVSNAPTGNRGVVVTPERIVVALCPNGVGRDIAWSDQEDITVWTAAPDNQAGDFSLTTQGEILAGRRARNETLIWTTTDLHTMRYIGGDLVYSFHELGANCGAISRQSMTVVDGKAIWMGLRGFYVYDGFVRPIENEIADYVFNDLNVTQLAKVVCFPRSEFAEVVWHYPSAGSDENDRYVALDINHGTWTMGQLERTSGVDRGAFPHPLAADASGNIYLHEVEGGTYLDPDSVALTPYAESGPIEIGTGEQVMMVRQVIPDERISSPSLTLSDVSISMYSSFYPTSTETLSGPFSAREPTDCRLSGRQVRLRVSGTNPKWRVGTFRLDVEPAGKR